MDEKKENKQPFHRPLYLAVGIVAASVISVAALIMHTVTEDIEVPSENEISDDAIHASDTKQRDSVLTADGYSESSVSEAETDSEVTESDPTLATENKIEENKINKNKIEEKQSDAGVTTSAADNNAAKHIYDRSDKEASETALIKAASDVLPHMEKLEAAARTEADAAAAEQTEKNGAAEIMGYASGETDETFSGESGEEASALSVNAYAPVLTAAHSSGGGKSAGNNAGNDAVNADADASESAAAPDLPQDILSVTGDDASSYELDGTDGVHSGEPRQFLILGDYSNLCVGQSTDSIFSAQSGRSMKLLFDEGYVTIIDGNNKRAGVTFSSLDTSNEVKSATATVSFTYGIRRYSFDFHYSVVPWSASLYFTDENTPDQQGLIPNANLRLDLSRYYTLYKRMDPLFCGWRTEGGTELYSTACIMTAPDMKLYPCFSIAEPEVDGDICIAAGAMDVDTTVFGVYPDCKKLVIGADVLYINLDGIAAAFPGLEEIEAASGNAVYSSYNGALYKDNTLIKVPANAVSLEIKEGTAAIADNAFSGADIETLVIPDTVKEIEDNAFAGATIAEITVPVSVKESSPSAFVNADANIGKVIETGEFAYYEEINGEKILVRVYQNAPSNFVVEAGAVRIAGGAFEDCTGIKTVSFADNALIEIGDNAFRGCTSLGDITLPENVASIGESAFEDCDMLGAVTLSGDSLKSIGGRAFAGCGSLSSFGKNTGYIDLRGLETIGSEAFRQCPLITSVYLSDYITETPDGLFRDCVNLNTVSYWGAAVVIGEDTFRDTGFVSVTLDKITDIKAGAFADCARLNSFLIGSDLVSLDDDFAEDDANIMLAFAGDTTSYNGESADALLAGNKIYKTVFTTIGNDSALAKYFYTQSTAGEYRTGQAGGLYSLDGDNIYTLVKVGPNLTDFTMIDKKVTAIMSNAFEDCDNIRSVVLNRTVAEIPARLLEGKAALQSVKFKTIQGIASSTDVKIGDYAFRDCPELKSITFNTGVTSVGVGVCENCTGLYSLEWGANAEVIPENAFKGCTSLTSVSINTTSVEALREVGDSAFEDCVMLVKVNGFNTDLFSGVTKIGNRAFRNCAKIRDIMLPFSVESIGDNCFDGCENLMSVRVYCGSRSVPFMLGSCVFGSAKTRTDAQCFDVWTTDKEVLGRYCDAWRAQLDGDYGDGATETIVISSKLLDDDGDVVVGISSTDQESDDGDNSESKTEASGGTQPGAENTDAESERLGDEETPTVAPPTQPDDTEEPEQDAGDAVTDPTEEPQKTEVPNGGGETDEANEPENPEAPEKSQEPSEPEAPEESEEPEEPPEAIEPEKTAEYEPEPSDADTAE